MAETGAPSSFRKKIARSAGLSSAEFAVKFGLRLVSTVILTRMLAPDIYGVFAVVLVYQYMLEMFSDLGLRSFVITKEGALDDDLIQTCWTASILRGAFILTISGLIALLIAGLQARGVFAADSAYAAEALPYAIFALGGASLLFSFQSINLYVYERNMAFAHVSLSIILASVIGLAATIGAAWVSPTVWALVIGATAQFGFQVVYSFLAFKGPSMRLRWHRPSVRLILDRGKWLIGHSSMTALASGADRLLLGILMDSTTFGLYYIALQVRDFCLNFLTMVHGRMGLQVFTHILQAPPEVFRRNYYKYRLVFDAMAGLGAGTLIMIAGPLVDLVFDDRYAGVAPILQILALAFVLVGPNLLRAAFSAERRFRETMYLSIVTTVTLWAGLLIAIFVFDSLTGALLVIALHTLPEALILAVAGRRRNWVRLRGEAMPLVFLALGLALGWGLSEIWARAT